MRHATKTVRSTNLMSPGYIQFTFEVTPAKKTPSHGYILPKIAGGGTNWTSPSMGKRRGARSDLGETRATITAAAVKDMLQPLMADFAFTVAARTQEWINTQLEGRDMLLTKEALQTLDIVDGSTENKAVFSIVERDGIPSKYGGNTLTHNLSIRGALAPPAASGMTKFRERKRAMGGFVPAKKHAFGGYNNDGAYFSGKNSRLNKYYHQVNASRTNRIQKGSFLWRIYKWIDMRGVHMSGRRDEAYQKRASAFLIMRHLMTEGRRKATWDYMREAQGYSTQIVRQDLTRLSLSSSDVVYSGVINYVTGNAIFGRDRWTRTVTL